ncbi:hypothetical protein SteCoe_9326 [Stentor coeruleus]|uniref:LNR domain-containing protein n=1 Tax=Stentor coeruleus TaxID=5963 RepID=A0A1R2CI47_9CILI|nr:hypothetical protein SteCoe_9326 [Stentor coeruleus]
MFLWILLQFISGAKGVGIFTCSQSFCPESYPGDKYCDKICMTLSCGFDYHTIMSTSPTEQFVYSDCYQACINFGCNLSLLANGVCDQSCNDYKCGWDLGDCGYCAKGCTIDLLNNGVCNSECNNQNCMFDNNDCGWCAEGCFYEEMYDIDCQQECNIYDCNYDDDACTEHCSTGCPTIWIGDGICDPNCYNSLCDYDNGDCDCSIGCISDILNEPDCRRDDLGIINDPCATVECAYKNGKCGNCGLDCFDSMLGDGVCDINCYVSSCDYDIDDCDCNPGCQTHYFDDVGYFNYLGECNINCMVTQCNYNYDVCDDEFIIQSAIFYQVTNKNWTLIYDPSACNDKCNEDKLRYYAVQTEQDKFCKASDGCNTEPCLNCFGHVKSTFENCSLTDGTTCFVCSTMMLMEVCVENPVPCPLGYDERNELGELLNVQKWCFLEPVIYSKDNYKIFYVDSNANYDDGVYGTGTEDDPINDFYYALISVFASYTKIILKSGDYNLQVNEDVSSPFIVDPKDPLNTLSSNTFTELWLIGDDEESPSNIYWQAGMKLTPKFSNFYLKNLNFYGNQILQNCEQEYCFYCPIVQTISDTYYDDRGETIDSNTYLNDYGKSCETYNKDILFKFTQNTYIENINFEGFRNQFYAFIYSTSNLSLKNVNFIKMQAVGGGGIIIQECNGDCENINFYFDIGRVEDLGSGYEDTELVTTGSFFIGTGYSSSQFYNIDFKYNFVFSNIQSSYSGYLIYTQNHIGGISIINCTFENNYMNYGIYVDVTNLAYSDYKIVDEVSTAYSQIHFQITDTEFHHNYCTNNLISYFVKKTVHNIVMDNIIIEDIVVGGDVVSIDNSGKLSKADYEGLTINVLIDNVSTKVTILPREIIISNIIFDGVITGQDAIYLSTLPLVYITNMTISSVSDGSKINIKNIIENFASTNRYLSRNPSDNEIPSLSCFSVTYFSNLYYLELDSIEIYYTGCKENSGPAGLYIDSVTSSLTLTHIYIHDITELSNSAISLYVSNVNLGNFDNMAFSKITNYDDSVIEFFKVSNIVLTNFTVNEVLSTFTGAILLTKVKSLTMSNFDLLSSESKYGNGGCFLILSSTKGLDAKINNGSLSGCKATTGNGGGIYLDSGSTIVLIKLSIKNVEINDCISNDGAMIYFSPKVAFDQPSVMEDIIGNGNTATQGGTIGDNHSNGLLAIKNLYMQYNNGLHSGIYAFYIIDEFLLSISDSIFLDNDSDESFLSFRSFKVGCTVKIENITLSNIGSIAFDTIKINIEIYNITADKVSGLLTADSYANILITNGFFSEVLSAAIFISKTSFLTCYNCIFDSSQETIITTVENSGIDFQNCSFTNNKASATSIALLSDVNINKENSFTNCIFEYNSADIDAQIYLSSTNLIISNCSFYSNACKKGSFNGIYLTGSNLKISDSDFENQQTLSTGGFLYSLNSEIVIERSSFKKGVAYLAGGAFYLMTSNVLIKDCEFAENEAYSFGGSIAMIESSVNIYNSQFVSGYASNGDGIWASTGTLLMENIEFSLSQAQSGDVTAAVYSKGMKNIIFKKCSFKDPQSNVGGIISFDDIIVTIEDSIFENLTMNDYSAATFIGTTYFGSVTIKNSIFTNNNSTGNGGAIYSENYDFTIRDSKISFNHASLNGGGLYLITPLCGNCSFSLEGNTDVFNNSCGLEGGGMKWLNFKPNKGSNVKIYDNSATYGANSASKAIGLQLFNLRELKDIPIIDTIEGIPPGQEYTETLKLYLYDSDGNVVSIDSSSQISLTGVSTSENNTEIAYSVSGTTTFTAEKGVFYITQFIPNGKPGSQMALILTTGGISTEQAANDNSTYSDSAKIIVNLRECINGETIGSVECIKCPAGKYLIEPAEVCKACPTGATCYGGDQVVSNPGYWRSDLLSEIVYECQIYDSCIGGNETAYLGDCFTGYTGILCQTCTAGFSRNSEGKCNKCPNQTVNVVILFFFAIVMIGVSVVLVKSTLKSAFTPSAMHSIYIKIFTNYLQLVFLTTQFNLNWPSYVMELFSVQRSAATISEDLFSVDCYLDSGKSSSSKDSYYYKLVLLCAMPIIIVFISIAVWLTICLFRKTLSYLRREFFTTLIVLFFLVYPNIVQSMFTNFSCVDVDKIGYFLEQNTGIKCWDKRHTQYSLIVALPGIIMWAIAAPALLLLRMYKRRRYFHRDNERVMFGFMYNGYKKSHFYWEFIIMYRKIIVITISVFMGNMSTTVQALIVVVIMLVSLYLQYEQNPYSHDELNHMEYEALFTASLTLYCGLFYLTSAVHESVKIILFILIVIGNFYFISFWVIYMFKAIVDLTAKIFPVLREMLKKGDAYEEDFNNEELVKVGTFYDESEGTRKCTFMYKDKETNTYLRLPKNIGELFINFADDDLLRQEDELDISRSQESQISDFCFENKHEISKLDSSADFAVGEHSFRVDFNIKGDENMDEIGNLETNRISTARYDKNVGDLEDDQD